jgi:hypothetical protein
MTASKFNFKPIPSSSVGYPILLVIIAAAVRSIPVVIAWPYAVGFDTNASYLPWMILGFPNSILLLFRDTVLSQIFMNAVYAIYPHPFEILDAFGIFFQAALTLSVYLYARKAAKMSDRFSFVAGLAFSLSILTLRLTWDQYRMGTALILVILTWVLLSLGTKNKMRYFAIPISILVVFSDPLPAIIFIGSMIIYLILKRSQTRRMQLELSVTATVIILQVLELLLVFTSPNEAGAPGLGLGTFGGAGASLNGLSYLLFTCWPLLVLAPLAFRSISAEYHWTWLLSVLVFGILSPFTGLSSFSLFSYWLISFPLAILFALALEHNGRKIVRFVGIGLIVLSLLLVVFWVSSTPEAPNPYFSTALSGKDATPIGYLQTTVDLPFQAQLMNLLNQSINCLPKNSTIYLAAQFYGFALVIPNHSGVKVTNIGEIDPNFFNTSFSQIASQVGSYTLWLTQPNGWYGVGAMPSNFHISINGGQFSLYYIAAA